MVDRTNLQTTTIDASAVLDTFARASGGIDALTMEVGGSDVATMGSPSTAAIGADPLWSVQPLVLLPQVGLIF